MFSFAILVYHSFSYCSKTFSVHFVARFIRERHFVAICTHAQNHMRRIHSLPWHQNLHILGVGGACCRVHMNCLNMTDMILAMVGEKTAPIAVPERFSVTNS